MAETTTAGITPEETVNAPAETTAPATPEPQTDGFSASEEMELNVSLDQLSYICEYCGKVNAISSPSCVRCGKRRPRSEYVNAMNKLKNAESVKSRYIEEQAKLATDRQEAAQEQLVRLVESRVADEKAQILAQDEIRLEQERDNIKRTTARDAVLRIIAAEKAADERVKAAELETERALRQRDLASDEAIAAEREKVLYVAAKRIVSERAGIENAAEDRIQAEKKYHEMRAADQIDKVRSDASKQVERATDEAERNAARRAALKIIAGEQATADRAKLERDAISRAAIDRIREERYLAESEAFSKYTIEKEAMQRAMDERIVAEREFLGRRRAAVEEARVNENKPEQAQTVQPLAIVPYVNSTQPLYQYKNMKQVYKFVPDEQPTYQQQPGQPAPAAQKASPKAKKDFVVMWLSFFAVVLGLVAIFVTLINIKSFDFLRYVQAHKRTRNIDVFLGLIQENRYTIFAADCAGSDKWFLPSLGLWIMIVGAVITVIMGIVGMAKCKVPVSFFVYAAVAFVGAIITYVGLYLLGAYETLTGGFASIGLIIILAATLLLFIFGIICTCRSAKAKKAEKAEAQQPAVQPVAQPAE